MIDVSRDPQWSPHTTENVVAAERGVIEIARRFREDDDEQGALVTETVGGIFVHGIAAVCSALADVAAAVRDRPPA